jgi:fatty acid desaturase
MTVAAINHWAILVAVALSFAFGGLWYSLLSQPWLAALGKAEEDIKRMGRPMPVLFAVTIAAQLIMAWVLAGLIAHLGPGQITITNGLVTAALVWIGFVVTTLSVNHGYQGSKWSLTAIDGGHWLGVLLIQGAVIGALGAG